MLIPIDHTKIVTPDYPIDSMPTLSARLGKAGCARIRQAQTPARPERKHGKRIVNRHLASMQAVTPHASGPIDDILAGIARLDWGSDKPLSTGILYALLQCLETFTTPVVMEMLATQERRAQKYIKALELCLTALDRQWAPQANAGSR